MNKGYQPMRKFDVYDEVLESSPSPVRAACLGGCRVGAVARRLSFLFVESMLLSFAFIGQ
eukprot:11105017-Lingulodinium_polyedra.AAC.1